MNWNRYTMLEIIEQLAEYEGGITSEDHLSEIFDEEVAPLVLENYSADDVTAFNEAFNNWSDGLTREGRLHEAQYSAYEYVGKYS